MSKYNLLLGADLHFIERNPPCRLDDLVNVTQWEKLAFIRDVAREHSVPFVTAGDILDHWKASPWLLTQIIRTVEGMPWFAIPGQHDLPQHNLDNLEKSGYLTLLEAGVIRDCTLPISLDSCQIWGAPFGEEINFNPHFRNKSLAQVAVLHQFTYFKKAPFPGVSTEHKTSKLFRRYPWADLILVGDNHIPFSVRNKSTRQLIINPGSIVRLKGDQDGHLPRVYLWSALRNEIQAVYLPIDKQAVTREHLEKVEARDERISSYVEQLKLQSLKSFSFYDNLQEFFNANKTNKAVEQKVWGFVDSGRNT